MVPTLFDGFLGTRKDLDIYSSEGKTVIELCVPGFKKEEISVKVENGGEVLTIEGKHAEVKETKTEFSYTKKSINREISERFALPRNIEVEKITTSLVDGILIIECPKKLQVNLNVDVK